MSGKLTENDLIEVSIPITRSELVQALAAMESVTQVTPMTARQVHDMLFARDSLVRKWNDTNRKIELSKRR